MVVKIKLASGTVAFIERFFLIVIDPAHAHARVADPGDAAEALHAATVGADSVTSEIAVTLDFGGLPAKPQPCSTDTVRVQVGDGSASHIGVGGIAAVAGADGGTACGGVAVAEGEQTSICIVIHSTLDETQIHRPGSIIPWRCGDDEGAIASALDAELVCCICGMPSSAAYFERHIGNNTTITDLHKVEVRVALRTHRGVPAAVGNVVRDVSRNVRAVDRETAASDNGRGTPPERIPPRSRAESEDGGGRTFIDTHGNWRCKKSRTCDRNARNG